MSKSGKIEKIAIIGDIHSFWDKTDTAFFSKKHTDYIFFVGDLPNRLHGKASKTASLISKVTVPGYFFPGNHDAVTIPQLIAEILQTPIWAHLFARNQCKRVQKLRMQLKPIQLCQYNVVELNLAGRPVSMICGRPHSMGGTSISMRPYLQQQFQVSTISDSVKIFEKLLAQTQSNDLIFLGHNGPSGLGEHATDIWGNDFQKHAGDFGDTDLEQAIRIAKNMGKRPLAVIAGHMHHHIQKENNLIGQRKKVVTKEDCIYINAAKVPRIFAGEKMGKDNVMHDKRPDAASYWHHYTALDFGKEHIWVYEVLFALDNAGQWKTTKQLLAQIPW